MVSILYYFGMFDMKFKFMPEVPDCAGNRPCCRITERADGVSFNFIGNVDQQIDITVFSFALFDAP